MRNARIWIAGALVTALVGAVVLSNTSRAGENKALLDSIDKIAETLKKGDKDGAKQQAEALAKKLEDLYEAMDLFKPRKKGGFGVGDKPGVVLPDGIEQMLIKIGRDAPAAGTLNKNSEALEQMGYRTAAIGLIALAKTPATDKGKQTRKDWTDWTNEMVDSGIALAAAAKAKGPQDVKTTAAKVNNSCNSCHSVFR
jgi:cytochrome c556